MSSFPACQVCQQTFCIKGPAPFLLPCLHAVCETCLTSAAGGVISCTTCQRDVNLTETQLQKDLVREKEIFHLTVQHHPAQIMCTHEDDSNQAVCWCKDCEDFLCEHCQMLHESFKATKKHDVLDLSEIQPGCIDDEQYCTTHRKYPLEAFDKTCNILICSRCRRGEHVDHEIEDLEDAAKSAKTELTSLKQELETLFDKNRAAAATFRTELQSSTETCGILSAKISHTFQSLKTILDQREKELLVDLHQQKKRIEVDLSGRATVSELNQHRCRATTDYVNKSLLYSSKYDILNLMSTVEKKSQECLRDAQIEDHPKLPVPQFCDRGLGKLKSALSKFGSIVTDGAYCSDTSISQDTGIQTEETMAYIEDLEKIISELKTQGIYLDILDQGVVIQRYNVEFDTKMFLKGAVHVTTDGHLVNKENLNAEFEIYRFKKYMGTRNTVPLPKSGLLQYYEVETLIDIKITLPYDNLLLEIGLVREEEQDQNLFIGSRPHSYSLTVGHCSTHSSICRQVWKHGNSVLCLSDTVNNCPGTSSSLHYGIAYDHGHHKILLLDVGNMTVIAVIADVDDNEPLWPMFGVYNKRWATVHMSLVVGKDIKMTDEKRTMILKSL